MKLFRKSLLILCTIMTLNAYAQNEDAVIIEDITDVTVASQNDYTSTSQSKILINKERASALANFRFSANSNAKITKFQCSVSTTDGRVLKKYKQSDLKETQYSAELASDARSFFLIIDLPVYPAIVSYEVTVRHNNNVLTYPTFIPMASYNTAVKHASYTISTPENVAIQYSQPYSNLKPIETIDNKERKVMKFEVNDLKPIKNEIISKPLETYVPIVYIAPQEIDYYGSKGSQKTWIELGRWVYELLQGQDAMPEELKAKVHSITDACNTDREKIEALYKYLGESTRYVSIQLGIGGYRLFPASFVWKNGFGDCKALTNYMMSMLREIGIESTYTLISTKDKKLIADNANFMQLNHVILKVPQPDGDIWLECTNPTIPFGYIHDGIAGHNAVEITSQGGRLITLPEYKDEDNLNASKVEIDLKSDGNADILINDDYLCHMYGNMMSLARVSMKEQADAMTSLYNLPFGKLQKVEVIENIDSKGFPHITTITQATNVKISTETGSRLFVNMNPMHNGAKNSALSRNREHELHIEQGYSTIENITLNIPEGMNIESLPQNVSIANEIGSFCSDINIEGNKVIVKNILKLNSGTWAKEKAALYDEIRNKANEAYNARMVMNK